MLKFRLERRRTAANSRNSPSAHSDRKRQKKNRKGSATSTVISNHNSVEWRFCFWFHGEKQRCMGRNFFNWLPAILSFLGIANQPAKTPFFIWRAFALK
jgi:hypothetical protein